MKKLQYGFSLIELLVVVIILVALAGIGMQMYGDTETDTQITLSIVELQRVAEAVRRFHHDTGYYPRQGPFDLDDIDRNGSVSFSNLPAASGSPAAKQEDWFDSPANLYQLVTEPLNSTGTAVMAWDIETGSGWRGPYLSSVKLSYVDLSNDLNPEGFGEYDFDTGINGVIKDIPGLYDAIQLNDPPSVDFGFDADELVVDWRSVASTSSSYDEDFHEMGRPGSPYLLFIHDVDPAGDNWPLPKVVAVGENGRFDGTDGGYVDGDGVTRYSREDWCTGLFDDTVICL